MKKKLWISISLAFVVIVLCAAAFEETPAAEEKAVRSLSISELSQMLLAQDDAELEGETVSVTGFFGGVFKEGTEDVYGLMYLASPDACCAESIKFFPDPSCTEFPDTKTIITLTGTLKKAEKNGFTALRIYDAVLSWEESIPQGS